MFKRKVERQNFAPKGEIAPVRAALLAFAPVRDWKLPDESVNPRLKRIATEFNLLKSMQSGQFRGTLEAKPVRFPDIVRDLEEVERTAAAFAKALVNLNEYSVKALVGAALARDRARPDEYEFIDAETWRVFPAWRDGEPRPQPKDDFAAAFGPEIETPKWRAGETPELAFLNPTIARAVAVARIAKARADNIKSRGPDKGGTSPNISAQIEGKPKPWLVEECFWLVADYFGERGAAKCTATTVGSRSKPEPPPFHALLQALVDYAAGESDDEEGDAHAGERNFGMTLKAVLPELREKLTAFTAAVPRPFPLEREIRLANERRPKRRGRDQ
jgi:hypothetical protein